MNLLILKTNIDSNIEFLDVKENLLESYSINDCTIDLEDRDKVLRLTGSNLDLCEITKLVKKFRFSL